jgi:pyrroloquinoline-quinone synthase
MNSCEFLRELDARIAAYDLLQHPFYQAWTAGELDREDLREYALDYYEHVHAFPSYLAALALRLEEGSLRRAVLANMNEELGREGNARQVQPEHAKLWMDFATGMGDCGHAHPHAPVEEIHALIRHFSRVAGEGSPEEALAAFYAYESQVPRIAGSKEKGLRECYGADDKTCAYFTLHQTADVHHAQVWRKQLEKLVAADPEAGSRALAAAETAARALWHALDGIEARRQACAAV